MSVMKIAFIGQKGVLPSARSGGVERRVFEIGKRLVKEGHQVTVYARRRRMPGTPKIVEGMHIKYIPTIYTKNLEAIVHTFLSTLHAMWRGYDIYDYHGVGPSTLCFLPRVFKKNSRVFATFHARDQFHQKWGFLAKKYLALGERAVVSMPHYPIVVSHLLQVFCRKEFKKETICIPNGADVQETKDTDIIETFELSPKNYYITVGRLIPFKGIHFLIEAYRQSGAKNKLAIIGSGDASYEARLKKMAEGDDRIVFLGFQEGRALQQLFSHASALFQPSESEGLPLTVLEAMAYGIAPIVSDIPENLEAVHDAGFVFKSADVNDLKKLIDYLEVHEEELLEKGALAKKVIEDNFTWDRASEEVEELYIRSFH